MLCKIKVKPFKSKRRNRRKSIPDHIQKVAAVRVALQVIHILTILIAQIINETENLRGKITVQIIKFLKMVKKKRRAQNNKKLKVKLEVNKEIKTMKLIGS